RFSPHAELIAGADYAAAVPVDLDHLLTLDFGTGLVLQAGDDLAALDVDDVAGRRVGVAAVQAERHPAGLVAQDDVCDLLRRHHGRVENVDPAVVGIGEPDLALVGRQTDAVARAAVALGRSLLEALHLDAVQLPSGGDVADLETEQLVDIHETERLA